MVRSVASRSASEIPAVMWWTSKKFERVMATAGEFDTHRLRQAKASLKERPIP